MTPSDVEDKSFQNKSNTKAMLRLGTPDNKYADSHNDKIQNIMHNSNGAKQTSILNSGLQFAVRTRAGFSPNMVKKPNQDSFFTRTKFLGDDNIHLFGVCDGHGVYGQNISQFVRDHLPVF